MIEILEVERELTEIDRIMNLWFRRDVVADCNGRLIAAVETFNAWVRKSLSELEAPRSALKREQEALAASAAALQESNARLEHLKANQDSLTVQEHNRLADAHEALVRRHLSDLKAYDLRLEAYNQQVRQRETERVTRKRALEEALQESDALSREYTEWRAHAGHEEFSRRVNRFHAQLHARTRQADPGAVSYKTYLDQVQMVREELGAVFSGPSSPCLASSSTGAPRRLASTCSTARR